MRETVTGKLTITSKGFGFVLNESGPDVFVARDNLGTAMDGDIVEATVFPSSRKRKPAGSIRRVVERNLQDIVGVFRRAKGGGTVIPEDDRLSKPLFVPKGRLDGASREPKNDDVVVARLDEWKEPSESPKGHIVEILGHKSSPGIEMKIVARSQDFPLDFSDAAMSEVAELGKPSFRHEARRRNDLRRAICFTIDPESARDFDDAVSLRQLKNGRFELGVHIADVSYFVREGSALDQEAMRRGTSVYFVHDVIPMLPERLSNDLCSLRPGEDRLAYSVLMEIDSIGTVHRYSIEETVIRSKHRFTYGEVEEIIRGSSHRYASQVHLMQLLGKTLRSRREEEGSIDFDMTEQSIVLDENGIPREIRPKERLDAHRMIEEFMLIANKTVATHIATKNGSQSRPFIYRVHPEPKRQEAREFVDLLDTLGIPYRIGDDVTSEDYRNILNIVANFEFKDFVEKVALRSMTKAVYSTEDAGHFGLAFEHYTHFTSPIRRYPDLMVHRLLKEYQAAGKRKPPKGRNEALEQICEKSTNQEIKAVEAEREYIKLKSMQFLSHRVGNTYQGIVSGVAAFGLFVELKDFMTEGLVHVSTLGSERFELSEDGYALIGRQSGTAYRLGDRLSVTVKSVSVEDLKADFVLSDG